MELEAMVGAFADLGSQVDRLHKHLKSYKPIHRTIFGAGVSVSASNLNNYALVECTQKPALGRIWNLRSIHLMVGSILNQPLAQSPAGASVTGSFSQSFSNSFAAAAAGTLTITTAEVLGWRVDPAAAWPAGTNQVTITQLNGGTQTYDLPGGTTNPLIVNYGQPLQAPFGNPVISVPAIVGGPAYSINATGVQLGNGILNTAADVYIGTVTGDVAPFTGSSTPDLGSIVESNLGPMPFHETFTRGVYWVKSGEELYVLFSQVPGANLECVVVARVDEYPVEAEEAMRV